MAPYVMSLLTTCLSPMLVKAVGRLGWSLLTTTAALYRHRLPGGGRLPGASAPAARLQPAREPRRLRDATRWLSTALFSLANTFYGLTPNGFKVPT